jgi:SAM-dependent methyltransferase
LGKNLNTKYYSHLRQDLVDLVEGAENKILEIGCGEGITGGELKRVGKAKEVVGVEMFEPAALKAEERLDKIILGDIEVISLPYPDGYFDYIILGDVVEHLSDPWATLKQLKRYLSSTGFVIASIPNITYWKILKDLILFDKWEYVEEGILDRTHLRFFTKKSLIELFQGSGLLIKDLIPRTSPRFIIKLGIFVTLGWLKRFCTAGYLIKARKNENRVEDLI